MSNSILKPIGRFFPIDKNGYLLNDTDWSTIPSHWQSVITEIITAYQNHLSNQLISIYVRGSVARNVAVDGFSDIDTFALIKSEQFIRWGQASFQPTISNFLIQKYNFVSAVEMQLVSYHPTNFLIQNPKVVMLIQTQSLCVFGEDITATLPKYRPDRSICLNHHWLDSDVHTFLEKTNATITISDIQAILKVIIRCGFELVIEQEKQFTLDLYLCYQVFSKYYPAQSAKMKQALIWYISPPLEKYAVKNLVETLGKWLINAFQKNI